MARIEVIGGGSIPEKDCVFPDRRPHQDRAEMLEVALRYLEECERRPDYQVDMQRFHAPQSTLIRKDNGQPIKLVSYCLVCLAGAYAARHGHVPITRKVSPVNVPIEWGRAMSTLDDFREVIEARMGVSYALSPPDFHRTGRQVVRELRAGTFDDNEIAAIYEKHGDEPDSTAGTDP